LATYDGIEKTMTKKKANKRSAKVTRSTKETDIRVELTIEGKGKSAITTSIPFMDHMLTLMAAHGFFDLTLDAKGDVEIDEHHTVEDIGIVLGEAFDKALGDRKGMKRYGRGLVPMDEALASVVIDFSNRPFLVYNVNLKRETTGRFDAQIIEEFFRAFVNRSGATVHINLMYGENTHHIIEAVFKAFSQGLDEATMLDDRITKVRSTKGIL
jgi:imidazoleglycerol-phosphate dehydratase